MNGSFYLGRINGSYYDLGRMNDFEYSENMNDSYYLGRMNDLGLIPWEMHESHYPLQLWVKQYLCCPSTRMAFTFNNP